MAVTMVVPGEETLIVRVDVGVEISVGVSAVGVLTILIDQEILDGVDVAEAEVDIGQVKVHLGRGNVFDFFLKIYLCAVSLSHQSPGSLKFRQGICYVQTQLLSDIDKIIFIP